MINQITYLKKRFGEQGYFKLKKMNERVDKLAALGHKLNLNEIKIAPKNDLILLKNGSPWEGNMNAELKAEMQKRREERLDKIDPKNKDDFSEKYTFNIFKEKGRDSDRAQEILSRLMNGGLKSLNNRFNNKCHTSRKKLIHDTNYYTDQCEYHKTLAETQHIIFDCENSNEEQKRMLKKINKFIENFMGEKQDTQISPWWENNSSNYDITVIPEEEVEIMEIDNKDEENIENDSSDRNTVNSKRKRADYEGSDEDDDDNSAKKKARMEKTENDKVAPAKVQRTLDEMLMKSKEKDKIKEIIIEKEKLSNKHLKRKREQAEINNKKIKKRKKSKLSAKELGSKGFINKILLDEVMAIAKNDEKKAAKIIIEVQIYFMKYVERMHKAFWQRHYTKLKDEGIDNNVIYKDYRDTGFS